jgi:hypothetical protein
MINHFSEILLWLRDWDYIFDIVDKASFWFGMCFGKIEVRIV